MRRLPPTCSQALEATVVDSCRGGSAGCDGLIVPPQPHPIMPVHDDTFTVIEAIKELGISVSIAERGRGGMLYLVYYLPGGRRRTKSTRTRDLERAREVAREFAVALAHRIATARLKGEQEAVAAARQDAMTLGEAFDLFRQLPSGLPRRKRKNAAKYDRVMRVTEAIWGRDCRIATLNDDAVQTWVDTLRQGGFYVESRSGKSELCHGVADRTIRGYWVHLKAIVKWVSRQKIPGTQTRYLSANPLDDVDEPPATVPEQEMPIASHERYEATLRFLRHSRQGDGNEWKKAMLAAALAIARYTGRRRGAIAQLQCGDILLTRAQVEATLLRYGRPRAWADAWPYGAIVWRWQSDKKRRGAIIPICRDLCVVLRWYMRSLAMRGHPVTGDAPLFPGRNPAQHIRADTLNRWLRKAEVAMRDELRDRDPTHRLLLELDAAESFDRRGRKWEWRWHAYRRLWRTERSSKGFHDKLVAACGGWKYQTRDVVNQGYLQFPDPRDWYACVVNDPDLLGWRQDMNHDPVELVRMIRGLPANAQAELYRALGLNAPAITPVRHTGVGRRGDSQGNTRRYRSARSR